MVKYDMEWLEQGAVGRLNAGYYGTVPIELNPSDSMEVKHQQVREFLKTDTSFTEYLTEEDLTLDDIKICVWSDDNDENSEYY